MAKKRTTPVEGEEPSFEEALEDLETLVRRLEQGGGALDQALSDYSTAIGLLKSCNGQLEAAERRVEILSGVDAQGNPITRPVADSETTLEEKQQTRGSRRSAVTGKGNAENARKPENASKPDEARKSDEAGLF